VSYSVYLLKLERDYSTNGVFEVLKVGITKDLNTRINYKGSDEPWPIWKCFPTSQEILYNTEYRFSEKEAEAIEQAVMSKVAVANNSLDNDGNPRFHNFSEPNLISGVTEMRKYTQSDADLALKTLRYIDENVS